MLKDYFLLFMCLLIFLFFLLIGIAFFTLMERKILGYIQLRKGPNKVGYLGLIQPFGDALKLFTKELVFPIMSNFIIFIASPVYMFFLSLFVWICIPFNSMFIHFSLGILFFLSCSSIGVYFIMMAGWSSNSNYSMLGSLRSIAQVISYEVSMYLIFLSFLFLIGSFNMYSFILYQYYLWFFFLGFPLGLIMFISLLAETNRSPFDLAEGESELVSGFNIEYSGGMFALIFMAEYSMIMVMSFVFTLIFLGGDIMHVFFFIKTLFVMFVFLWVRGTLPRLRYDKLMYMCWKSFLPVSLNFLMLFFGMSVFCQIMFN
uniref:NADH-ubiquinone oxidoreductase chain 1 n=1 Tax=Platerodrilus sp. MNCN/DNA:86739 TaxID=1905348 RepID=A0A342Z5E6_9COLE|nr:NADH dehydrogenase subunit 1 [Platerodrilus sp. MNCN/DNA:86739]